MITQLIYNQESIYIWGQHQICQWTCQSDVSSGQVWVLSVFVLSSTTSS